MLSLRSFHLVFVCIAIVITAGVGTWGLMHHALWLGIFCLAASVLLVVDLGFVGARRQVPLE